MGLPVSIHLRGDGVGPRAGAPLVAAITAGFEEMRRFDRIFSPYRDDSILTAVRAGALSIDDAGPEFAELLVRAGEATAITDGAFDVHFAGQLDPSGLVKGWAAERAAERLTGLGVDWYLNAGGDIACAADSEPWRLGVEHPGDPSGLITVVALHGGGLATSGSAHRGAHIIDPRSGVPATGIRQVTVIGPSLARADVWATAIVARGRPVLADGTDPLITSCVADGYQVFAVDDEGAVYTTSGFAAFQVSDLPSPSVTPFSAPT